MKTVLLVSDIPELQPALLRWFRFVKGQKVNITDLLSDGSSPEKGDIVEWDSLTGILDKNIKHFSQTNIVLLIDANFECTGPLRLPESGMEVVHYIRSGLESRIPIIVICIEEKSLFIESHPFHQILGEKSGHYYWRIIDSVAEFASMITQVSPFSGSIHDLKRKYCTLPGLAGRIGHEFSHYLNHVPPRDALAKAIKYLKSCLPVEQEVLDLEEEIERLLTIDAHTARKIMHEFERKLPSILARYKEHSSEIEMNIKVVLFEDDLDFRTQAKIELERRGLNVVIDTENPDEIITVIDQDTNGEIDAALLDWRIGNDESIGPKTCQQIKSIRPQIKVYALTVIAGPDAARIVARHGFDDYFYKPKIKYEDVVGTIVDDVKSIREQLPKSVALSQDDRDAYFRIVTKADRGRGDIDEIIKIAKTAFRQYSEGEITESLGRKFGVARNDLNIKIKNILINRLVILGMYKAHNFEDYEVLTTLKFSPEQRGIARETDIRKGEMLLRTVLEKINSSELTWEDIEIDGYQSPTSIFKISKIISNPSGARFYVEKQEDTLIKYDWNRNENRISVASAFKFSQAFKQVLLRCGLHRRTLLDPDSMLPHERELLIEWPI